MDTTSRNRSVRNVMCALCGVFVLRRWKKNGLLTSDVLRVAPLSINSVVKLHNIYFHVLNAVVNFTSEQQTIYYYLFFVCTWQFAESSFS